MRKGLFLILVSSPLYAGNLTGYFMTDVGTKMARQSLTPSAGTTSKFWDGTTGTYQAAGNETITPVLYLENGSGSDATNVSVVMSNLVGPSTISSIFVSSSNVWDTSTRPIQEFYVRYLQILGFTKNSYDIPEYEERDVPPRFQNSYTVNGNNDGVPDAPNNWATRPDANAFYPEILVPYEEIQASSFTVAASSSQAIVWEIFVSTNLSAGSYTGTITIAEGGVTDFTIPVKLTVLGFSLPNTPTYKSIVYMDGYNINYRIEGSHFPAFGGVSQTSRDKFAMMFKRHGLSTIGDSQGNYCSSSQHYPCPEYQNRLSGALYTAANGYGNARGVGIGDPIYAIGSYGSWQSLVSTSSSLSFCTYVSSWGAYFKNNFPSTRSFLYLADESLTGVPTWSEWMSTAPACQTSGYTVNSWVTSNWTDVNTNAPYVNMPATTGWIENGYSSTTWQTLATHYETTGTTQAWDYNGHPSWGGSSFSTEDSGTSPIEMFWADYKKGVQGHFFWHGTYWTDSDITGTDTPLWTQARTFGGVSGTDSSIGQTGYRYSNGDGVLSYPGTDKIFTSQSYGFDGAMPSWRLESMMRGIEDIDYLTMANTVNPSSTTAIVNSMAPVALFEHACFNPADCSYSYGGRSWPDNTNNFESQREALAQIIAGSSPPTPPAMNIQIQGTVTFKGTVTFQ